MKTFQGVPYAQRLEWMTTSVIRDLFRFALAPGTISFAGGWPDAGLFPREQLAEIARDLLLQQPEAALQYGQTDGWLPLRQLLAQRTRSQGVPANEENIVITSGAMQAIDLIGRLFLEPGDAIVVESPSFLGALQAFRSYGVRMIPVPVDDQGMRLDSLSQVLETQRPKLIYCLPNFQNPTGVSLSLERREALVALAAEKEVLILEDDPYGELRYSGHPLPSLLSLEARRHPENSDHYTTGRVIYVGSFSKILAPGLRVAWAVCPPELAHNLVMAKQSNDLHTSSLAQAVAYEFVQRGLLPAQIRRIRETYRRRRDAMLEALARYMPNVQVTRPDGGLFLWVTLPENVDALELLAQARTYQVAFVPGTPFFVDGSGRNTLRLSFATADPPTIQEGVRRLATLIADQLRQASDP